MLVGYCRCSTADQNLNLQIDALTKAGCKKIFQDVASGSIDDRRGLQQALEYLKPGQTLAVWRLDRLSRSLKSLIETINMLNQRGVGFRSLTESIDTTSASGRLTLHVFGALAEFERELIRHRTIAGLAAARSRGRFGGRPLKLSDNQSLIAEQLFSERKVSVEEIAKSLGVSRATIYRNLKSKHRE